MTETNSRLALAALRFVGELKGYSGTDLAMIAATLSGKDHAEVRKAVEKDIWKASGIVLGLSSEEWGKVSEELLGRGEK